MSRPLTKDKKKCVRSSTDRSRGRSTGVGPLVLKIPPFYVGPEGGTEIPRWSVWHRPRGKEGPRGTNRRNFGVGMLALAKSVIWWRYRVFQAV